MTPIHKWVEALFLKLHSFQHKLSNIHWLTHAITQSLNRDVRTVAMWRALCLHGVSKIHPQAVCSQGSGTDSRAGRCTENVIRRYSRCRKEKNLGLHGGRSSWRVFTEFNTSEQVHKGQVSKLENRSTVSKQILMKFESSGAQQGWMVQRLTAQFMKQPGQIIRTL